MISLELLRYDILQNGKKIAIPYYIACREHVWEPPRGIFSLYTAPLTWNTYSNATTLICKFLLFISQDPSQNTSAFWDLVTHSPHRAPQLVVSTVIRQSIMWYCNLPVLIFIIFTLLLDQRLCLVVLMYLAHDT